MLKLITYGIPPVMAKLMVADTPEAFASVIACRREPAPLSAVVVTVYVAAPAAVARAKRAVKRRNIFLIRPDVCLFFIRDDCLYFKLALPAETSVFMPSFFIPVKIRADDE